jgi:hypothetical protein
MPYSLERLNWVRNQHGCLRKPGRTRVAVFADYAAAVAAAAERESAERAQTNPFACGAPCLYYQSRFDNRALQDWVYDAGLEPPQPDATGIIDWVAWFDAYAPQLTESQRHHIWEACDRVCFYDVVEVPARQSVYVVLRIHWEYNDEDYNRGPEGGAAHAAFRNRERAEAERERLERAARAEWESPFRLEHSWHAATSLSEEALRAAIDELNLPQPDGEGYWHDWWDSHVRTHPQCSAVWNLFDRVRFYEVVATELE